MWVGSRRHETPWQFLRGLTKTKIKETRKICGGKIV